MQVFFLALALVLFASGVLAETRSVYSPNDGYLNLRTGPGAQFRIVQKMYNGSKVEVLEYNGKWRRVRHESGSVGWAHGRWLVSSDYSNNADTCWIILGSFPTLQNARNFMRNWGLRGESEVYLAENGYYRITLGKIARWDSGSYIQRRTSRGEIPTDSYCRSNSNFVRQVYP